MAREPIYQNWSPAQRSASIKKKKFPIWRWLVLAVFVASLIFFGGLLGAGLSPSPGNLATLPQPATPLTVQQPEQSQGGVRTMLLCEYGDLPGAQCPNSLSSLK